MCHRCIPKRCNIVLQAALEGFCNRNGRKESACYVVRFCFQFSLDLESLCSAQMVVVALRAALEGLRNISDLSESPPQPLPPPGSPEEEAAFISEVLRPEASWEDTAAQCAPFWKP